jgi:riboflavin kinase / FMN adenylyltransferase
MRDKTDAMHDSSHTPSVRLDIWLWAARFFKTRSLSKTNVDSGKVRVNDEPCKPSKALHLGDRVTLVRAQERLEVMVKGLSEVRAGAPLAAGLYQETEASIALRIKEKEANKLARASFQAPATKPDKQARRKITAMTDEFEFAFDAMEALKPSFEQAKNALTAPSLVPVLPPNTRLIRDIDGPAFAHRTIVTIGAFDALHLGHQAILRHIIQRGKRQALSTAVVCFEPLPREYFKAPSFMRVCAARDKFELMDQMGVQSVAMLRFNQTLVRLSAEAFIEAVLVRRMRAKEIHIGADFRFGNGRTGDVALLIALGEKYDFSVHVFDDVLSMGERISATRVRECLLAGDFAGAKNLLGRPYRYQARVQHGQKLGRSLGFPTANLMWPKANAMRGIFAVMVQFGQGKWLKAVASLGTRPVVNGVEPLLEVHVLDFRGELYGVRLHVEFVAKLRDEWNFPSLDALVAQIKLDVEQTRLTLAHR